MAETPKLQASKILDLSTTGEIEREFITIDGVAFELRNIDELSITQQQRVAHAGNFIAAYFKKTADAKADLKAGRMVNECLNQIIVDLPEKVSSKLSDRQKLRIVEAFNTVNSIDEIEDDGEE